MASTFSSVTRSNSTFRNDLSFLVRQRYFTNASLPLPTTRSSSNRLIKSICVSQHRVLKTLLLMWSSPAALVKVKLSASRASTGPQSFFSHAAYHLRMTPSLVVLSPVDACALAAPGKPAAPASAQAPALSRRLRDTAILVMIYSPFRHMGGTTSGVGQIETART